ncbi:MAG: hypothetical protein BWY74_00991 [Firmicutes bacterium ADurb.Bin419]|nr:MAG: hypothetical protein BWY74_00991 [Firmicutes bacterium ADurb.Bin419]
MTDTELIRETLQRLNLTYKAAAAIVGMSEVTFKRYGTSAKKVKPQVWRSLLEYEAKTYQRHKAIRERVQDMGK